MQRPHPELEAGRRSGRYARAVHRDCGSRGAGASQGRPKGGPEDKYRLAPVYKRLQQLLPGVPVLYVDDCIGDKVAAAVATAPNGSVLLLENVRFYKEEEANDPEFAKKLAAPAQLYVNDAFGTAHRAHASTEGVTKYLKPAVAGFLLQKELDYLARRGSRRPAAEDMMHNSCPASLACVLR